MLKNSISPSAPMAPAQMRAARWLILFESRRIAPSAPSSEMTISSASTDSLPLLDSSLRLFDSNEFESQGRNGQMNMATAPPRKIQRAVMERELAFAFPLGVRPSVGRVAAE